MINIAAGAEWRNEQYRTTTGDPESWTVGPYGRGQGFSAGSNGFFGYGPMAAGTWSRRNVAHYGDVELNGAETDWTLGTAVRVEHFDDFGTTMNSKLSGRFGFVRASVSSGFRAPPPGQLRPGPRRPGEQRHHPVHLAGGVVSRGRVARPRETTPPASSSIGGSSASPPTTSGSACPTGSASRATSP